MDNAYPGTPKSALCPCQSGKRYRDCHLIYPDTDMQTDGQSSQPQQLALAARTENVANTNSETARATTNVTRTNWYSENVNVGDNDPYIIPTTEVAEKPRASRNIRKTLTWGILLGIIALFFIGFLMPRLGSQSATVPTLAGDVPSPTPTMNVAYYTTQPVNLIEDPGARWPSVIAVIPAKSRVEVIEFSGNRAKIAFDGQIGWINRILIAPHSD